MLERALCLAATLNCALWPVAHAQSVPAVRAPSVEVEGESAYGPVDGYDAERSATATRTDTLIRDVPQSVQVVPRAVIEDQTAFDLIDVLENVSNVQPQDNDNSDESFVIRGFNNDTSAARDGAGFKINGSTARSDLAGVERVEVLKGPASVLYGTTDPGGMINIVSKRPLARPDYVATLTAGSFDFYRAAADASGPVTRSLRYRFNAVYERSESFRDFFVEPESVYLAPTVSWNPRPSTELIVFAEYQKTDTQLDPGLPVLPGGRIPDIPFSRYYGEAFAGFEVPVYQLRYVFEESLNDRWSLRATGAVQDSESEETRIEFRGFEDDEKTLNREARRQRTREVRYSVQNELVGKLRAGDFGHTVLAGIAYSEDRQSETDEGFELDAIDVFDPVYSATLGPRIERLSFDQELDALGLYVQDQIRVSQAWILVAGLRFDRYHRSDRFRGGDIGDLDAKVRDRAFSPRLGAVYQPAEWLSVYANTARSFRPQIGVQQSGIGADAERGRQIEAGIKFDLFDNRASATLSVFDIRKENVLTTDPGQANFVLQTGEQRSRGVEIDIAGDIAPGLKVIANAALLDAVVVEDPVIAKGTDAVNAPRLSGRFWGIYRFRGEPLSGLTLGAGLTAVSNRNGNLFEPYNVPGYVRLDAVIAYRLNHRIQFSLNFKNVTDKQYINSAGSNAVYPGAPFSVFGKVELRL